MGQGMDWMNESWEPEEEESMPRASDFNLIDEVAQLRIESDNLFKRAKKAEAKNKALTAERDQLRAQLEVASNNARHYADRTSELEAQLDAWKQRTKLCSEAHDQLEAQVDDLRGALEQARTQFDWIRQNALGLPLIWQVAANSNAGTTAAIKRTSAQSLPKIQANAIRAACVSIGTKKQYTANEVVEIMRAKADRLEKEATNG